VSARGAGPAGGDAAVPVVEAALRRLVLDALAAPPELLDDPAARRVSLWELGIDSASFMALLGRIEDDFGVSWGIDVPPEATASFDNLVFHVARHGRSPAAPRVGP
jgi:Phosphopantetheine attachment site